MIVKLSCSYFYKLKGFKGTSSETGVSKKKKRRCIIKFISSISRAIYGETSDSIKYKWNYQEKKPLNDTS